MFVKEIGTASCVETENMSHKNVTFNSECSHYSPDFALSQTYVSELKMAEVKTRESIVLNNESNSKNTPPDCEPTVTIADCDIFHEKNQSEQAETEIAEETRRRRNNNGKLSHNKHLDDREADSNSKHEKMPEGSNSLITNIILRLKKPIKRGWQLLTGSENETDANIYTERAEEIKEDCDNINTSDIKTLGDALNKFNLSPLIEKLEDSLEHLRRRKQNETDHEKILKDVDKHIQRMSLKFHPDRVLNRGGTEQEIKAAQLQQTALNAVRTVLNILSNAFLEDLETDHRYGFYLNLELSSLSNENEAKSHIYEVLFKISLLSEIKQRKIIAEIQKFLGESQHCVESYFDDNKSLSDFKKHRESALFHLRCCIEGYEKLQAELKTVEKDCERENLDNIGYNIRRMAFNNQETLTVLRDLNSVAEKCLDGKYQFFPILTTSDDYFIRPFVCYVNVMLMCGVMIKNKIPRSESNGLENPDLDIFRTLKRLDSLVSSIYCKPVSFIGIIESNDRPMKKIEERKNITQKFNEYLVLYFNIILKETFKESDYTYDSVNCYLSGELQKCMKLMSEFQKKEKELTTDIENLKKEREQMREEYKTLMKQHEEFIKELEERK